MCGGSRPRLSPCESCMSFYCRLPVFCSWPGQDWFWSFCVASAWQAVPPVSPVSPVSKAPSLLLDPLTFGPLTKHADSPRETDPAVTSEPFPTVASESTACPINWQEGLPYGCSKQFQSFGFNLRGLRIDAFSDCLVLRTTVAWLSPLLVYGTIIYIKVVGFGRWDLQAGGVW